MKHALRALPSLVALMLFLVASSRAAAAESIKPAEATDTNAGFSSAVEALGMMAQVVGQLAEQVKSRDLSSIHSEDLILNASLAAILQQTNRVEPARRERFAADVTQFGQHVAALHLAGDTRQQSQAEQELRQVIAALDRINTHFPEATLASARAAASQYLCAAHRDVRGGKNDVCPKCGSPLEQQVRLLPAFCGLPTASRPTIRATVRTDRPLVVNEPVAAVLQLSKADGSPVYPYDLITAHTEKIHLLLIDSSLTDYHHEHPQPTRIPGQYSFRFTPGRPGGYFVWADVRPHPIGLQEYATTFIPALIAGETPAHRTLTNTVTLDGLIYELTFAREPLKVGRPAAGRLRVRHLDGKPFLGLEPFMSSFAHLVGFYEDHQTILHLHPKGPPVLNREERGGPEIEFQLYALKPGFMHLFAQVQIEGASKVAPFGVQILP